MSLEQISTQEFSQLTSYYFNTAYFGPTPSSALELLNAATKRELNPSFYPYHDWISMPDKVRSSFAKLINSSPQKIFHSTSVSDINSLLCYAYPWEKGDYVCSIDGEYPSNVIPWMVAQKRGILNFKLLPKNSDSISVEFLEKHLPPQTKFFCLSHVSFNNGVKSNIAELGQYLKERGVYFIVDVTQSLGGLALTPQELSHINLLTCATYKWLLGPYGHAFGHLSSELLNKLERFNGSWIVSPNSQKVDNLLDYTDQCEHQAKKFDRGQSPDMLSMWGLQGSLEFLNKYGLHEIEKYNANLVTYFLNNLSSRFLSETNLNKPESISQIVCLKPLQKSPEELIQYLKLKNFDVSLREGNVRFSFHVFNNHKQVQHLLNVLEDF